MSLPTSIGSRSDVEQFFTHLVEVEAVSLHPDTPFADYVNVLTGEQTFTPVEAAVRDDLMAGCFLVVGDEVYDLCLEAMSRTAH